jgi:hypothetical protein
MVNVLVSSVVDFGFEPWLGQTKIYKTGVWYFSINHAAWRSKRKDWLAWYQVSNWCDMSTRWLTFQWAWSSTKLVHFCIIIFSSKCSLFSRYENPTQRVGLVQSWYHHRLVENVTCSPHDIAEKLLICVNQQSLTHSNHTSYRILYHLWQIVMPRYNWNTVESGVKQHNPDRSLTSTSIKNIVSATVFFFAPKYCN